MTNKSISQLTAGAAVSSTDIFPDVQTNGVGPVKVTAAQIGDYVLGGSGLTSVLPVARGGTGFGSITSGYVPYATGTNTLGATSGLQFDGSNLGLGVTPSAWASGSFALQNVGGAFWSNAATLLDIPQNAYYASGGYTYSSTNPATFYRQLSGEHRWYNAPSGTAGSIISFTQAMTLDASGRLGVGLTSLTYPLETSANGGYWNNSNNWSTTPAAIVVTNKTTGGYDPVFIGRMTDSGGTSKNAFAIGAVGTSGWTAGNNASQVADLYIAVRNNSGGISERMRIDSSGNVGIGTTSPTTEGTNIRLAVVGGTGQAASSLATANSNAGFSVRGNVSSGYMLAMGAIATSGFPYIQGLNWNGGAVSADLCIQPYGGNVGIGTTSPSSISGFTSLTINNATYGGFLDVQSNGITYGRFYTNGDGTARLYNQTANALVFGTSGTENARIDSSGNLLVGTTSTGTGGNGFKVQPAGNGAGIPITILSGNTNNDANGAYHVYSTSDAAYKFYATYAGKIYAVTTTVQAITSDVNLKTDIQDYDYGLAEVCSMKPRYFRYKTDLTTRHAGFIAQEMDEAIPGSMIDAIDGKNKTYSADWYPILVKAIQELAAKVQALEAKVQ